MDCTKYETCFVVIMMRVTTSSSYKFELTICQFIHCYYFYAQRWLLPLQPLSEEAQLWEMQKRGISLTGGHELFQLWHLLGVHSAKLLPVSSLWIGGGEHKTHKTITALTQKSLPAFATLLQTSTRAPLLSLDMLTCVDWIRMRHREYLTLFASHTFVSTFRSRNAFQPQCTKCLCRKFND